MRKINKSYADPLDLIWTFAASEMGMRIVRSAEVNASWDGRGTLTIGTLETLDPDDSLAQMVLHETCHALCEGPDSLRLPDWGLGSFEPAAKFHEHACLRLQAALADSYGLRAFFAATTNFRAYYDQLPMNPLEGSDDPSVPLAQAGWERAQSGAWSGPLHDALRRTAVIAQALRGLTTEDSLWHCQGEPKQR